MKKIEEKIKEIELQILESHVRNEKDLVITEMKKIGIDRLPYSYAALKTFIDPETMDFHYNKHYKGYVNKLNDALSKTKHGDIELEKIITSISRYNKTIRNNAGGAFNHSLFWKMLSPTPKKLEGALYDHIVKQYGTFSQFKKEFEKIAKERFGSGWVWLVLTPKNTFKLMSTPNQDNPLMNIIEGGGFPILGLDLWEHAYYLKYRDKRNEYISSFWKVVNWDFVTKLYEMKKKTKMNESLEIGKLLTESTNEEFCSVKEVIFFKFLIDNWTINKIYQNGITEILKSVFHQFWVDETAKEMAGFYGIESKEGRSLLNNLNTNFNTFCLLVKAVNKEIEKTGRTDKLFDFSFSKNRTEKEVQRFISALDYFKKEIFTKHNQDFINIIKVLKRLWERGQKSENSVQSKLEDYFEGNAKIEKVGGHGVKDDAIRGIDIKIELSGVLYTAQIKPYSLSVIVDDKIELLKTGNVKPYKTNWLIFIQNNTNKILIFDNHPISTKGKYVFKISSLKYEIE